MSEKQYVQHISGQGEKWELFDDPCDPEEIDWQVKSCQENNFYYLPKSEYRLCSPPELWRPELWRDVTEDVDIRGGMNKSGAPVPNEFVYHNNFHLANLVCGGKYRLRKVQLWTQYDGRQWAFIVEQKVQP